MSFDLVGDDLASAREDRGQQARAIQRRDGNQVEQRQDEVERYGGRRGL
jgi:hypothetical protein